MLNYHFGSRVGLLAAIVSELERRQRVFLAEALRDRSATADELAWRIWEQVADERLWPYERLFFEMSGRALQGDPDAEGLRSELVDPWLASVDELGDRFGLPPAEARAQARLGVAVTRVGACEARFVDPATASDIGWDAGYYKPGTVVKACENDRCHVIGQVTSEPDQTFTAECD